MSKYTDLETNEQRDDMEKLIAEKNAAKTLEEEDRCFEKMDAILAEKQEQDEPTMDDLGENIERVVYTKKEVKQIRELFDEVLSDFREAIAQSVEGGDEVMVKLALNALDSDFDKVREKLNKILGGE